MRLGRRIRWVRLIPCLAAVLLAAGLYPAAVQGMERPAKLLNASDVYKYVYDEIATLDYETALVLFVGGDGAVLDTRSVSQGKKSSVHVVPWELVLSNKAPSGTSSIYLVHNHPRGSNWFSQADIAVGSFWHHVARAKGYALDLLAVTSEDYVSLLETDGVMPDSQGVEKGRQYLEYVVFPGLVIFGSQLAEIVK